MTTQPTGIGVAVVEKNDCYLVGIRGSDEPFAELAEFPGGKCEVGETPADCARRECFEETGLLVETIELLFSGTFQYVYGKVDLHFWLCQPTHLDFVADKYRGFHWVPVLELPSMKFPRANQPVIDMLVNRATQSGHRC